MTGRRSKLSGPVISSATSIPHAMLSAKAVERKARGSIRATSGSASWLSWAVAASLTLMAIQSYSFPLLSGAVNWDPSFVPISNRIQVNDTNPAADFGLWYYYLAQQSSGRAYLRIAAGMASLAWATCATFTQKGLGTHGFYGMAMRSCRRR